VAASDPGWLARSAPAAADATPRFLELYERACAEPRWFPEALRRDVFLLVPGLFTERYPLYLQQNEQHMRALGVELRQVACDTEQPLEERARAVREAVLAIAREGRPAVLVGHSKGPIDAHAALVLHPEICPHVRALISLQAPFAGTPLATDPAASRLLRRLIDAAIRVLFQGSPRAFWDLTYEARRVFLATHPPESPVPAISLVTTTLHARWPLELTRRYLQRRYGTASDGFVAALDGAIPGSRLVRLERMDHAGLALGWFGRSAWDAGAVTQALLAMAADQPGDRARSSPAA
jgi:triacylglycerol lipase